MAETQITESKQGQVVAEEKSQLEKLYEKYFGRPENIDVLYHRDNFYNYSYSFPSKGSEKIEELESRIRDALCLDDSGLVNIVNKNACKGMMNSLRSVLANLPKIKDEKTKKRVLYLVKYCISLLYEFSNMSADERKEAREFVARVAVANGIASHKDLKILIEVNQANKILCKKLFNDLLATAKENIKQEKANDVPKFQEIKEICENVINAAQMCGIPLAAMKALQEEFNAESIIAGDDYVARFEQTVEMQHIDVEIDRDKIRNYDSMNSAYHATREENESLRRKLADRERTLFEIGAQAETMIAGVFNQNINATKAMIAEAVARIRKENQKQ